MALARPARRLAAALALALLASGCAMTLEPPTASGETVERMRPAGLAPMRDGAFALAPGRPPGMDTSLGGLRANTLVPASGRFSLQLRDELVVALRAAGLHDPASDTVVDGWLVESHVDAGGIASAEARLAVRFAVRRAGRSVYDRELRTEARWASAFAAVEAIPMAVNQYQSLYKRLIAELFEDPDFRAAVARR